MTASRSAPQLLAWGRAAVDPALRAAVAELPDGVRRVVEFHFGWCDEHGRPASGSNGKAFRPTLVLLSATAAGGARDDALPAAVAVELVHNFSLLHDDVMDGDVLRRHRATAWSAMPLPSRTRKAIVGAAVVWVLSMAFAASAPAATSCAYAGAPLNTMTVNVASETAAEITRRGQEITANEEDEAPRPCAGGVPTVTNTDTIKVQVTGRGLPFVDVLLENGAFAPGATAEAEGASEIEIVVAGPALAVSVLGTPRDDEFHWGPGGGHLGLNVNPGDNGDADVDVTVSAEDEEFASLLSAAGEAGNDTIIPAPKLRARGVISAFGGPGKDVLTAPLGSDASLHGGLGNDVLTGSMFGDTLRGDEGSDRIFGGGGADKISGGPGRDRISGGAGADVIQVRDFSGDTVTCGAGRDRVTADRRDAVRGCESLSRR